MFATCCGAYNVDCMRHILGAPPRTYLHVQSRKISIKHLQMGCQCVLTQGRHTTYGMSVCVYPGTTHHRRDVSVCLLSDDKPQMVCQCVYSATTNHGWYVSVFTQRRQTTDEMSVSIPSDDKSQMVCQ